MNSRKNPVRAEHYLLVQVVKASDETGSWRTYRVHVGRANFTLSHDGTRFARNKELQALADAYPNFLEDIASFLESRGIAA
jgi:hypothetical protein